jgi:thiamine biosynthesis lipoprotein
VTGLFRVQDIMGTAVSVEICDPLPQHRLIELAEQAFAWFREVDERFSTFKATSEVTRLDRGELTLDACHADTRYVLDECARLWRDTGGFFDAYAAGRLDPSGYVKGWSVQVASDRLTAAGAVNHCVNAGGDLCVRGRAQDGKPWRIGIVHPWEKPKVAWTVVATDLAVATSGTYERGRHIVDPFRGDSPSALASVTVIGRDLAVADAYATAAVAMGDPGLAWLSTLDGFECAAITADGRAFTSPRWPAEQPARWPAEQPARWPAEQSPLSDAARD